MTEETKPKKGITRVHNLKTGSTYRLRVRSTKKGEEGSILGKWKPPRTMIVNKKEVAAILGYGRCGLCDVEIPEGVSWEKHVKSDLHKGNLPNTIERLKEIVHPVKKISDEERKRNKKEGNIAHATNLGYVSRANGRSVDRMLCECGEVSEVFRWRGCKRCPNCWKILHDELSYLDKDFSLYTERGDKLSRKKG